MARSTLTERIRSNVAVDAHSGCHLWTRAKVKGYGVIRISGRPPKVRRVHIVAYELANGPVPAGMELDHRCHTTSNCDLRDDCPHRACCNPAHLEPVTHRVNVLRGTGFAARQARQTHCHLNHPLSGDNLKVNSRGARVCLTCRRASAARSRARRRERRSAEVAA